MQEIKFNAAQMVLLMIGGTAAGQAFGLNKDNEPSTKTRRNPNREAKLLRQYRKRYETVGAR